MRISFLKTMAILFLMAFDVRRTQPTSTSEKTSHRNIKQKFGSSCTSRCQSPSFLYIPMTIHHYLFSKIALFFFMKLWNLTNMPLKILALQFHLLERTKLFPVSSFLASVYFLVVSFLSTFLSFLGDLICLQQILYNIWKRKISWK